MTFQMRPLGFLHSSLVIIVLIISGGFCEAKDQAKKDWLVHPFEQQTEISERKAESNSATEIVMSNGLISRTWRIEPSAATVGFDNLMTGETILRGVKPEGSVVINGKHYNIGGLLGQPNYAFLTTEWIDDLKSDPNSLQYVGYGTGEPKNRLKWNRVRHHAPNSTWPPKGKYLRMDYKLPAPQVSVNSEMQQASHTGRTELFHMNFQETVRMPKQWKRHHSTSHSRSSFINEGKLGEIYTPANTSVYAERKLPAGTRLVETTIDAGTDQSKSWGPGIALVWKNQTVKLNLREGAGYNTSQGFGIYDGQREITASLSRPKEDLGKPWTLRLVQVASHVYCQAKSASGTWQTCHKVKLGPNQSEPISVRIGKLDLSGNHSDHSEVGDLVRLTMQTVAAYGEVDSSALSSFAKKDTKSPKIKVSVHYEMYDGIPALSKWITVDNNSEKEILLDQFSSEILAVVEPESLVEDESTSHPFPNMHIETDYAFSSFNVDGANSHVVHWERDPDYKTQVNYSRRTQCLLVVKPEIGPGQRIQPGDSFRSFRTFELIYDSFDRERKGIALRRMYRVLAPWVTENPLMMHARFADWKRVKLAIDQASEVGFEMVILTFGSGFNIENGSQDYIAKMKKYAEYARSKGVEIGGYSLLASRRVGNGHDVVMPNGKSPKFGNSPCLSSKWGQDYFKKLYNFYSKTGFKLLEHDGSYPGDVCTSHDHPGHVGHADSRWNQWRTIDTYYRWCREQGIYLNVPDYYFLAGSNKAGMGYRETNWSLPRAQQVIHTRQNIYDGSWQKTPSMGWMFVPLTQYQGGGAAATIEPLDEHLDHYQNMLKSNLGMGVQACYRGPRLFDTERTKLMVKETVQWYKKYRDILESDMVHGRRADGRNLDWMLHVNPSLKEKGMLVVYNPLKKPVKKTIDVNLYYTGLTDVAQIREQEGEAKPYKLARDYKVQIEVEVPAQGMTWFVME